MNLEWSEPFRRDFKRLPKSIQMQFEAKIRLALSSQFTHPSLRVKKMTGHPDIWEASVTMNYRFTFQKIESGVFLRRIGTHNLLRNP